MKSSRHFDFEQLDDGVWAALHRIGGWATANAGIVDLGGRTLVYDTSITAAAGRELADAAMALTGREADIVGISHYHNDHVRGSVAFPDAYLVSSQRTAELLDTRGRGELHHDREHARDRLLTARAMAASDAPAEREASALLVPHWEGILATLPEAEVRLPDIAFEREITFHGTLRHVTLTSVGRAHTPDDAILLVPDARLAFLSDVLFIDMHPWIADGDPEGWLHALDRVAGLPVDRLVPGHGRVGSAPDVRALRTYLLELHEEAARLGAAGATAESLEAVDIPEAYRMWALGAPFYRANLGFLMSRRH